LNDHSITAARVILRDDGTPFAPDYGDVYHSADGALAQARAVFIEGCHLPRRWAGRRIFRVLEAGFGLGINTLATAAAWLADPARGERLHVFSIEKHPASAEHLARSHSNHPELAALSRELISQWPLPLPGLHRLWLADGAVLLTLCFGDIEKRLPSLEGPFDAFYLDGFAPARNPAMWSDHVFKACARLAAEGATLATWSAAGAVRDGLTAAGFTVERKPGFGRKRHRIEAQYRPPAWRVMATDPATAAPASREVLIIGGGIAGAAVAQQFARRHWKSTLVDAASPLPGGASAIRAATLHPHLSPDDALLSRLVRNGFLQAVAAWRMLAGAGHDPGARLDGLAEIAEHAGEAAAMARCIAHCAPPAAYARFLDAAAMSARCGLQSSQGGHWYDQGGWVEPRALIAAQLEYAATRVISGREVTRIAHTGALWQAFDRDGQRIAGAPVLVLANAADAARLCPGHYRLRPHPGLQTLIALQAPGEAVLPAVALTGAVQAVALDAHTLLIGSHCGGRPEPDADDVHRGPLERWAHRTGRPLPALSTHDISATRITTPDHLPLAGPLPDAAAALARATELRGAQARDLPRQPGLYGAFGYGARGLAWSVLAAELIASRANGEPLPLERELADAIDPARHLLQVLRRGEVEPTG
jgi:tRNA 5-methylaminomethyl-2-thiouridine biosynthesis bifunctional protein